MKAYLWSLVVGFGVRLLYAAVQVKGPATPLIALLVLLGTVLGEQAYRFVAAIAR
jgi:XapX domain-containing protein